MNQPKKIKHWCVSVDYCTVGVQSYQTGFNEGEGRGGVRAGGIERCLTGNRVSLSDWTVGSSTLQSELDVRAHGDTFAASITTSPISLCKHPSYTRRNSVCWKSVKS